MSLQLVLLLLLLGFSGAAETEETIVFANNVGSQNDQPHDWLKMCREFGFDPEQLACSTCNILPEAFSKNCTRCCQSWLDTKRIAKPYAAAVLIDRGSKSTELGSFLDEDWTDLVVAKGGRKSKVLQRVEYYPSMTSSSSFFTMSRPSTILFFNSTAYTKNTNDVEKLSIAAVESVSLDGMKRDDIKKMLSALLPG